MKNLKSKKLKFYMVHRGIQKCDDALKSGESKGIRQWRVTSIRGKQ